MDSASEPAPNKRQKDAPHLHIWWSLHCFRAMTRRFATFMARESNNFLPQDVMRQRVALRTKYGK